MVLTDDHFFNSATARDKSVHLPPKHNTRIIEAVGTLTSNLPLFHIKDAVEAPDKRIAQQNVAAILLVLGLCFAVCVPDALHHHLRVGLGYLRYHDTPLVP